MTGKKSAVRLLALSDIQGNFQALHDMCRTHPQAQYVVHTGNFGFWDESTVENYKDINYLKQIVAFLKVLDPLVVEELNNLSTIINGATSNAAQLAKEFAQFKAKLAAYGDTSLSQLLLYLSGQYRLPCPVYTTFGPLDDPQIIHKFHTGEYHIPNLFIVDHRNLYDIPGPEGHLPSIRVYGLGGNIKIHSLFDNGNLPISDAHVTGKIGDLWITLVQVAELYLNVKHHQKVDKQQGKQTINVFLSYAPVIKTPLLEHLAIITNADYTISQGLHFRYPVMGNGMSFVDSMGGSAGYIENYRCKFSRLRMILGELWLIVKDEINEMTGNSESADVVKFLELGLSLFDKIPISINDSIDKIVPLTLYDENNSNPALVHDDDIEVNKQILKKINDYYFSAYYNLWHFNLCDYLITDYEDVSDSDDEDDASKATHQYNLMIFKLSSNGNFKLEHCNSQGFNFKFKQDDKSPKKLFNAIEYSPKTGVKRQVVVDRSTTDPEGNQEFHDPEDIVPDVEPEPEIEEEMEFDDYDEDKAKQFRGFRGRGRNIRGRRGGRGTFRGRYRGRGK